MLITVWNWFCMTGRILFMVMFIISIVCGMRNKDFKLFSTEFEKKHPTLVSAIYGIVGSWMVVGVLSAFGMTIV